MNNQDRLQKMIAKIAKQKTEWELNFQNDKKNENERRSYKRLRFDFQATKESCDGAK